MDNIQKAFEAKNRLRNPRENLQNFARGRQARDEMTGRTRTAPGPTPVAAQPPVVTPTTSAPRSMLRTAGRALGPAAGVGLAVPPVLDVATDDNSSLLDVGTEVASQGGRLATAGLGATTGAAMGAPLGPVGAAVGGLGGGIAGYYAGGRAIEAGRRLAGVDERDPSQRIGDTNRIRDIAMDGAMAGGAAPEPAAVVANDPAIAPEQVPVTLDGATGQPVTAEQDPLGYRRSRLAEFGVPENIQNSAPLSDPRSVVSGETPGTGEFQNLGDYGGNAPIFGRSTTPGGRVNDFTGVGDMARPGDATTAEDPMMTRLRSQMRVEDMNATTEVMRQNRLREMGLADRGDSEFYINREAEQAAAREGLRGGRSGRSSSNDPELSPSERTLAMMTAQQEQNTKSTEARAKIAEAEIKAAEAAAKAQESGRKAANASSEDAQAAINSAIDVYAQGDSDKAVSLNKFYTTLPVDIRQGLEALPATDKQAMLTNIFDIYEAQNEGLIGGKDAGATAQNATIMAALGAALPRLFARFAAPVGDAAIAAGTRGRVRNVLRNMTARTGAGAVAGGVTGASITPDAGDTDRFEELVLDPVTGQPQVAGFSIPDAFKYGAYDAIDGPLSDDYRTRSGRRVNAEAYNSDDRTAATRDIEALRRQIRQNGLR